MAADLPLPEGARVVKCSKCPAELIVSDVEVGETKVIHLGDGFHEALTTHETDKPKRTKHNVDGSTTATAVTPPKTRTDPKPRGRRRG